jgi:pimeloyl-ACP methyl ester carboxylesterase
VPETDVLDSTTHHHDSGSGTPLVFLHGNPASWHLWRNVLPRVGRGRLLAPDLIGMGRSGKPAIGYSFADHARRQPPTSASSWPPSWIPDNWAPCAGLVAALGSRHERD